LDYTFAGGNPEFAEAKMDPLEYGNIEAGSILSAGRGRHRVLWAFGFLVCLALAFVVNKLVPHLGVTKTALLLVLVPLVPVLFPLVTREAVRSFSVLREQLRWWHLLWLILLLSDLVFRIRNVQAIETEAVDAWAVYRITLVGLVGFYLLCRLAVRKTLWLGSLFRGLVGLLALYAIVCVISTVWSVFPTWTLYKSVEYMVDLSVLAAIVATAQSTDSFKSLFDWTYVLIGGLLAIMWVEAFAMPTKAFQHIPGLLPVRIFGVLPALHPNTVGEFGAILAIVALVRLWLRPLSSSERVWYWLVFTASFITLIISQTRSALAGLALGLGMLFLFSGRNMLRVGILVFGAVIPLTGAAQVLWLFVLRGQGPKLIASLSGRMSWWEFGWQQFMKQPWTGYGAYAGARFVVLSRMGWLNTSTIHNTFLEVLLGTGFWGLVPVLLALLGTWWMLMRFLKRSFVEGTDRALIVEALAVLSVVSVRSVFMTHLIWHPSLTFLMVVGYAEYLRRKQATDRLVAQPAPGLRPRSATGS
jgi:O-antigen ligase